LYSGSGPGKGLWWELSVAVQKLAPQQLQLLMPGPSELSPLTERLDQLLPVELPPELGRGLHRIDDWTAYVITFDAQWQAQVEPDPTSAARIPRARRVGEPTVIGLRSLIRARRRAGMKTPHATGVLRFVARIEAPILTFPLVMLVAAKIWSVIQG